MDQGRCPSEPIWVLDKTLRIFHRHLGTISMVGNSLEAGENYL